MNDYYGFRVYTIDDGEEAEECGAVVHMIRSYNHYCKNFNVTIEKDRYRDHMANDKQKTFPFIFCEGDNLFQYENLDELKEFLELISLSKSFKEVTDEGPDEESDETTSGNNVKSITSDQNDDNASNNDSESETDYGELISAGEMLLSSATEFNESESEQKVFPAKSHEIDSDDDSECDTDSSGMNGFDLHGNDEETSEDSEEGNK